MGYGWRGAGVGSGIAMALGVLFTIFILVGLIRLAVGGRRRDYYHRSSALDILNERYARGEINKEEYEIKKRDLS